ncbi:MAG: sulfatase [Proteobacteria bacterium]|nr:sulfatase [Pseudomonadota bacterium]MBU4471347.1 sulfatase [Pseudomonadota bacterium]MCG2751650.1 sulfatase [Desulfobacteraceae bacterium]
MKAIMIMFDSLNRHMLPPYGCDWVKAPNFERLAEKSVVFDNCYCGSLPCMPARRELHTGRVNFLHRSWGPIEPFDVSMPEMLKKKGIYTHLASDHYHYWEDGGCTYHTRYNTWEISRGQEGDPWKGVVKDPDIPDHVPSQREAMGGSHWRQDWVNRTYMQKEENQPQAKTFGMGLEFIQTNHKEDNWFLHIETFDPHEPFFTQQQYKDLYPDEYKGPHFDWPNYYMVTEPPDQVQHMQLEYAALVSMCDTYLGKVLDRMDQYDLWKDTLLILNTDHGFLLGEKDWWAKNVSPVYNEVAHIPLFIWDPRSGKKGEHRQSLVQTIDLAPTLLDYFGIHLPNMMQGVPLADTIKNDKPVRTAGLFGVHGSHVNVTDGRYVYMRGPVHPSNQPLFDYTLMPTHMSNMFSVNELQEIELAEPFSFTKGCRTLKIEATSRINPHIFGSLLFDLSSDPDQEAPITDPTIELKMMGFLCGLMKENDAPKEQFIRLGLPVDSTPDESHLALKPRPSGSEDKIGNTTITWKDKGKTAFYALTGIFPKPVRRQFLLAMEEKIHTQKIVELDEDNVLKILLELAPKGLRGMMMIVGSVIKQKGV